MGNLLVTYLRLRNEFSLVPNSAALHEGEGPRLLYSVTYVSPSSGDELGRRASQASPPPSTDVAESEKGQRLTGAAVARSDERNIPGGALYGPQSSRTAFSSYAFTIPGEPADVGGAGPASAAAEVLVEKTPAAVTLQHPTEHAVVARRGGPAGEVYPPVTVADTWGRLYRGSRGTHDSACGRGTASVGLTQASLDAHHRGGAAKEAPPVPPDEGEGASGVRSLSTPREDVLYPMDCADAYLYYHALGAGADAHDESAVFRAPQCAGLSLPELRAHYQGIASTEDATASTSSLAAGARFTSLLDDIRDRCRSGVGERCPGSGPGHRRDLQFAIAWRSVDRVNGHRRPSSDDGGGGGSGGVTTTTTDDEEEEEDVDERGSEGGHSSGDDSQSPTRYLGPPQHLTYGALWNKIECFGWGLRSLGLRAGGTVGLCTDPRWEALVTVYACWSQGLVPVVFADTQASLRAVAAEATDTRVIVCQRSRVRRMRRLVREAAAQAHEVVREEAEIAAAAAAVDAAAVDAVGGGVEAPPEVPAPPPPRPMPLFVALRDFPYRDHRQPRRERRGRPTSPTADRPHPVYRAEDSPEEEEEALWWSDVLAHGESKLFEHRTQQMQRWRRAVHRRQQRDKALRLHQHQQLQDGPQLPGRADSSTSAAGATSTQLTNGSCSAVGSAAWAPAATASSLLTATARSPDGEGSAAVVGTRAPPTTVASLRPRRGYTGGVVVPAAAATHIPTGSPPFPPLPAPTDPLRATDLAVIVYTDGEPRGVMLTHGALRASATAYGERLRASGLLSRGSAEGEGGEWGWAAASAGQRGAEASSGSDRAATSVASSAAASVKARRLHDLHPLSTNGSASAAAAAAVAQSQRGVAPSGPDAVPTALDTDGLVASLRRRNTRPSQHRQTYVSYRALYDIGELVLTSLLLGEGGYLLCFGSRQTLLGPRVKPSGDLAEFAPMLLAAYPDTLQHVCDTVEATLSASGYRRLLFDVGYEERRMALRRGLDTPFLNGAVFRQPRLLLGGRCRLVLAVGGPLHPRTQEYLEVVTGTAVARAYGPPESAGCGLVQSDWSGQLDSVGGPLGAVEVKLQDVGPTAAAAALLSHDTTGVDTHESGGGRGGWSHRGVRPRGELLLRGPSVACGYYRQVERAAETFDADGWLHTGDVAERLPDGSFRLLARLPRAGVVVRNRTGRAIALERLEEVYRQHPLCARPVNGGDRVGEGQLCVLAHPYRSYVCALVGVQEATVRAFLADPRTRRSLQRHARAVAKGGDADAAKEGVALAWPQCLTDPALRATAVASLNRHGRRTGGLAPHERLRGVWLVAEPWTCENGLRSATGRLQRVALEQRYAEAIAELFAAPR